MVRVANPLNEIEKPKYGDKIAQERSLGRVPIPEPPPEAQGGVMPPLPPSDGALPPGVAPPGMEGLAPHSQKHLWSANELMRAANAPRPGLKGVGDRESIRVAYGQIALQIAEATGDQGMYAAVEEIMATDEDPYDMFMNLAQGKMDDIEIGEGVFRGDIRQFEAGSGEPVQENQSNGEPEPPAEGSAPDESSVGGPTRAEPEIAPS